jgi:hypothetical protein
MRELGEDKGIEKTECVYLDIPTKIISQYPLIPYSSPSFPNSSLIPYSSLTPDLHNENIL